jgi:hypothetical protein
MSHALAEKPRAPALHEQRIEAGGVHWQLRRQG